MLMPPDGPPTPRQAWSLSNAASRLRIDPYILAIVGMVVLATVLPASGAAAPVVGLVTTLAIALLFFLYGARLSREAVMAGLTNWRLQLAVVVSTFVLFPALGLLFRWAWAPILGDPLARGLLYLTLLPSTVQSSIAFTSIARGNVAAAICSASLSNLIGVVLTPLLVGLVMSAHGGFAGSAIRDIALQLFLPFALGQLARRWVGPWITRHRRFTGYVDRGSILLVVYAAFSEGVTAGLWHRVDASSLALMLLADLLLLGIVLLATTLFSRTLGYPVEDEIAIVFCGSKKSLASGLPMANLLFAGQAVGLLVLPLMLFHQMQLMACAAIARRYARRPEAPEAAVLTVGAQPGG